MTRFTSRSRPMTRARCRPTCSPNAERSAPVTSKYERWLMFDSQVPCRARKHPEGDHDDTNADDVKGARDRPIRAGEECVADEREEKDHVECPHDTDEMHVLPPQKPKEHEHGDDRAGDQPR